MSTPVEIPSGRKLWRDGAKTQAHALAAFKLAEELGHGASSRPPVEHIRDDIVKLRTDLAASEKLCDELAEALDNYLKEPSCDGRPIRKQMRDALHDLVLRHASARRAQR